MQKLFRRTLTALLIVTCLLFTAVANAEIKTYEGIGDYIQTEDDPPKSIKEKAKLYAERNALEQAGVFIKSYSRTKNFVLVDDEIISVTGSILRIIDTTYEIIPLNDKIGVAKYRAKVIAEIDTDKIDAAFEKWLGRDQNERSALAKQNEELQRIIDEQNKKIAALEQTVRNAKTDADNQKVREEINSIDKETLYAQKIDVANKLFDDKKYADAVNLYTQAIELNPNNSLAYNNRGGAYMDGLKQYERAIADYDKAIELNPNYADAYYNRGTAYALQQQYERAIADYDKAIELNLNYADAYYNRGTAYALQQQYERAIADFNKAIELNPNNSLAYNNRGNAYFKQQQYERAIADYDKAIEFNPNYADAYYNRGNAYYNLQKYERAIDDYNKAIELNPNFVLAYNNRGWAYYCMKKYQQALKDFNKALELNPNHQLAKDNREACLKAMGK